MFELGEFLLGVMMSLVANAVTSATNYGSLPFFQRRKIERRVEDATAEVVEPLLPFLANEGVSEEQQRLLIQACVDELQPYTVDPRPLFDGSLDGQKIFDAKYSGSDLPQAIREEGLAHVYSLLFPRIATLLCQIPAAVRDWESQAWSENYRRLDVIAAELRRLFERLDSFDRAIVEKGDTTLHLARKSLAQRIGFKLDLTGLRSDAPISGRLRDFFVHPAITTERGENGITVGNESDSISMFLVGESNSIVLGAPGAGKSTWARWLQQEALTDQWTGLPVRCELRGLDAEDLPSMHRLVRDSISPHIVEEITGDLIREWINKKLIVVLFDGFDEISPGDRTPVLAWIKELRLAMEGCSLIVTSRELTTNHLDGLPTVWRRWNIQPFDQERIVSYIEKWYASTPLLIDAKRDVNAAALAETWRGDPTLGPLTGNPLLLSTLLMVHHLDGSLPSGRSELYRRYVDGMLGLWDDRRNVTATDVQLSIAQKKRILRAIAVHLQFTNKELIEEVDAVEVVQAQLEAMNLNHEPSGVLATLRERSGLIVGPGIYSFVHKSVSEYFVTEAIIQSDSRDPSGRRVDRFRLFENRKDDRWNVVTFLWSGLASIADVESFVEECIKAGNVEIGYGVLLDQYDRFTHEFRRRLLLQVLSGKTACRLRNGSRRWICGGSTCDAKPRLDVPNMGLRGLRHACIDDLISLAASDGTLTWADSKVAQGKFRDLLWMDIAANFYDLEDWLACMRSHPPKEALPSVWHYWVAECLMREITKGTDPLPLDFAYRFAELFENGNSYLIIAFMSVVVFDEKYRKNRKIIDPALFVSGEGATLFLELLNVSIDPEILVSTASWDWGIRTNEQIDLLDEFLRVFDSYPPPKGRVNSIICKILETVKEFKTHRTHVRVAK